MSARRLSLATVALASCLLGIQAATMGERCAQLAQGRCAGECRWHTGQCRQICFRQSTAYTGGMPGFPVTNHGSQELCRLHCQNIAGCVHFTYYKQTRAGHVHDAGASRQAMQGAVSGEPDCQPVGRPGGGALPGGPAGSTGNGVADSGESMPQSTGAVMRVGGATASSMFGGLFEERTTTRPPAEGSSELQVALVVSTGCLVVLVAGLFARAFAARPGGRGSTVEAVE